jgi:glycerophosphoryl diester phosphodiesterase
MRRIGHRGAKAHAPENTIASFDKAIALGCDEIETDVWLMEDGKLVIGHDGPVSSDGRLTLDDMLDHCKGKISVNVEMKCAWSDAQAHDTGVRVAQRLGERNDDDVYVSSFWYEALAGARETAPRVRRAFVYGAAPDMAALLGQARAIELWGLHPERHYVTPARVSAAHAAGLVMNVWTVNDPAEIARLASWGVDGIMSDYPERVPKDQLRAREVR